MKGKTRNLGSDNDGTILGGRTKKTNPTWGHIAQLLPGVLWKAWPAPAGSGHRAEATPVVTVATPLWQRRAPWWHSSSRGAARRQHGTHNRWVFAARWASIMHCIKKWNARAWSRQFKEAAWAKQVPKKGKICPKLSRSTRQLFMWHHQSPLLAKFLNTWEEITEIFKDTIFVFWMLIWHKGVCMRECL